MKRRWSGTINFCDVGLVLFVLLAFLERAEDDGVASKN